MPLTPQEVASKVFGPTRMRRGYDENEVDAFLDSVEAELTRLNTENERLRAELKLAGRAVPEGDPVEDPAAPSRRDSPSRSPSLSRPPPLAHRCRTHRCGGTGAGSGPQRAGRAASDPHARSRSADC